MKPDGKQKLVLTTWWWCDEKTWQNWNEHPENLKKSQETSYQLNQWLNFFRFRIICKLWRPKCRWKASSSSQEHIEQTVSPSPTSNFYSKVKSQKPTFSNKEYFGIFQHCFHLFSGDDMMKEMAHIMAEDKQKLIDDFNKKVGRSCQLTISTQRFFALLCQHHGEEKG